MPAALERGQGAGSQPTQNVHSFGQQILQENSLEWAEGMDGETEAGMALAWLCSPGAAAVASPEPRAAAPWPQCPPAPRGAARPWVPWGTREGVTVGTGGHWPSPGQGRGAPVRVGGCEQEGTAWHGGTWPWATTGTGWSWGVQGTPGLLVSLQGHPLPTHSGVGIEGAAHGTPQPCPQGPQGAQGAHRSGQVRRFPGVPASWILLFPDGAWRTWGPRLTAASLALSPLSPSIPTQPHPAPLMAGTAPPPAPLHLCLPGRKKGEGNEFKREKGASHTPRWGRAPRATPLPTGTWQGPRVLPG